MSSYSSLAQDLSTLTDSGYGHWMAATRLSETATSIDDYILVASEYEKAIQSDSSFIDAYMRLVHLYEKIGAERGDVYLSKAENYLKKYEILNAGDTRNIESEKAYIRALLAKSSSEPGRFVGVWVDRKYPRASYIFRIKQEGNTFDVKVSTAEERELETTNIIFDGEILSFTVKDIDNPGYRKRSSWRESGRDVEVLWDYEESFDFWKLSFINGELTAVSEWINKYYLNGIIQRRRYGELEWILKKR